MKQLGGVLVLGIGLLVSACSASPAPAQGPIEEMARSIHADCKSGDFEQKSACYDAQFGPIARDDVRRALDVLTKVAQMDEDVARDGHLFVHAIGIAAFDPARDFVDTFKDCTELFHAGCYHGLIQARLAAAGDLDAETVNRVCADVVAADTGHWLRFQCLHGVGHGVVIHNGHDLVKGLEACELLDDPWQRASCYGGAFMENVTNVTHPHHAALTRSLSNGEHQHGSDAHAGHGAAAASSFAAVDPEDPQYPCSIVKEHHKSACYSMQTAVILHLNGYDFGEAAETCEQAPELYRRTCHASLGRDASGFANRDTNKLIDMCKLDRTANGQFCYVGAVKAVIDWTGKPEDGLPFCRAIKEGKAQVRCYQAVGAQINVIVPDRERGRALCLQVDGDNQNACLWGAGLIDEMPAVLREMS